MSSQNSEAIRTPEQQPLSIRDVLRLPNYRLLWLAQIVSNIGDALTSLALVLLINKITAGSAAAIAGMMIVMAIPSVTVGLIAGAVVDRQPRKKVMISAEILQMLFILGFVALSFNASPPLWAIYLIALLSACAGAFFAPARMALIPKIVPEDGLMSANSLGQITRVLFSVIGTSLAGFLVGVLGQYTLVFAIDAITFIISPLLIWRIAVEDGAPDTQDKFATTIFSDIRQGLNVVTSNRVLGGALVGFGITMLGMGAVNVLLPPLVINELQVSETWFGAIELSQAAAMILSGVAVSAIAARFKDTRIVSAGIFGLGLTSMAFALVGNIWHLFIVLFAVGLIMTPLQAAASTIVQTRVEDQHMGRVGAAMNALINLASLISMLFAGILADVIGISTVFVVSGAITCLAAFIAAGMFYGATQPAPAATSPANGLA